jgi:hypothetical protein
LFVDLEAESLSRLIGAKGGLSQFPAALASVATLISTSFAAMRFRRQPFFAPDEAAK